MTPQTAATNRVVALTSDLMSCSGRVNVLSGILRVRLRSVQTIGLPANRCQIRKKKKEETMAEQKGDRTEILAMWIMVAVVVLLILAGTGWHMWTHPDWMHGG
jgi:hypothetical protein